MIHTNDLSCIKCGWEGKETTYLTECPICASPIEIIYNSKNNLVDTKYTGELRYHQYMPYEPNLTYEDVQHPGLTPLVYSPEISEKINCDVYIKNECTFATGTWKDREGITSIDRLVRNNIEKLVIFSSGNTGTSLALAAKAIQKPVLELVVPIASKKRVESLSKFYEHDYINKHFFEGSNDECIEYTSKLAHKLSCPTENGFKNYARREGLKSLTFELYEQTSMNFDWYVQPVAGAIGIYSMYKALKDINKLELLPRILGVQASICAPFVGGWEGNHSRLIESIIPQDVIPSEFVRVLRTRKPSDSYETVFKIMNECRGSFVGVSDLQIYNAMQLLYSSNYTKNEFENKGYLPGLEPCTALAGLIKSTEESVVKPGSKVILNLSGAAKPTDIKRKWVENIFKESLIEKHVTSGLLQ